MNRKSCTERYMEGDEELNEEDGWKEREGERVAHRFLY